MKRIILLILIYGFLAFKAYGQVCSGSLGDPIVNIDFGRGVGFFGPSLDKSNTNYRYVASDRPGNGYYTIEKRSESEGSWHNIANHTKDDPTGYMMMINANDEPGVFYEALITNDLCPNTTYEFSAWVANLQAVYLYDLIKPNLTFLVLSQNDELLGSFSTGDIMETKDPAWKQYGFLFSTPGNVTKVKIKIINNAKGGPGNDLVLDDITFRACGTKINAWVDLPYQTEKIICVGETDQLVISSEAEGTLILPSFWQREKHGHWEDLFYETGKQITINTGFLSIGTHRYRVVTAADGNFNSPFCRTASNPVSIIVRRIPKISVVGQQTVCEGDAIVLEVKGEEGIYKWTGPNGFTSEDRSAVIANASSMMSGIYQVSVNSGQCAASAQININVMPPAVAAITESAVNVCEGNSVTLHASGGASYKWEPTTSLSAPDIAEPIASPTQNTLYTVIVSNGGCNDTATVMVHVFKKITASAGKNRVIIQGQSITLDGTVTGDSIRYFWTPSDYLDDPEKLSPIATPLKDITYTLNVLSSAGCNGSTSGISVTVSPKLEIPNAFSPNGDGINDVWNIPALEGYPMAMIMIYSRYGEKVFSSTNTLKQWNGKNKAREVPVGIYYYVIDLIEPKQTIAGSIMVIR